MNRLAEAKELWKCAQISNSWQEPWNGKSLYLHLETCLIWMSIACRQLCWTIWHSLFADTVLNFIRSHPLMDSAVAHEHGRPVFVQRDVVFTRLAVHRVAVEMLSGRLHYTVYYVGTGEWKASKTRVSTSLHSHSLSFLSYEFLLPLPSDH